MDCTLINNKKIYSPGNKNQFLEFIENQKKILIAMNAEKIINRQAKLQKIINDNIGYPDGVGTVLALKAKGYHTLKLPGVELWLDIIKHFEKEKSFFIVGGKPEILSNTLIKLKESFPKLKLVGAFDGYFEDEEKVFKHIELCKPDIVFVALGSPKQEYFMNKALTRHKALYMGLGGSFDVYTGTKHRAPKFLVSLGLEWFYRLFNEPTRFKRQLKLFRFIPFLISL